MVVRKMNNITEVNQILKNQATIMLSLTSIAEVKISEVMSLRDRVEETREILE